MAHKGVNQDIGQFDGDQFPTPHRLWVEYLDHHAAEVAMTFAVL